MKLKLYTKTSALPRIYEHVTDVITEGNLLRLTFIDGMSEWYPITEVYRIKQESLEKKDEESAQVCDCPSSTEEKCKHGKWKVSIT